MTTYNDELSQYISQLFAVEDEALQQVRESIPQRGLPQIEIQPEEGRFIQLLVRASGATRALEIGTLGGYSGIWIARGLAPGGMLVTLEMEPKHALVAQENFALAGVGERVEVRVGNAHELLPKMDEEPPFDFVFIDADKAGYPDYYEWALAHTRPGGLITAHNAFRAGEIIEREGEEVDAMTQAMRAFNAQLAHDERVLSTIYPGGDGLVIAVKRA